MHVIEFTEFSKHSQFQVRKERLCHHKLHRVSIESCQRCAGVFQKCQQHSWELDRDANKWEALCECVGAVWTGWSWSKYPSKCLERRVLGWRFRREYWGRCNPLCELWWGNFCDDWKRWGTNCDGCRILIFCILHVCTYMFVTSIKDQFQPLHSWERSLGICNTQHRFIERVDIHPSNLTCMLHDVPMKEVKDKVFVELTERVDIHPSSLTCRPSIWSFNEGSKRRNNSNGRYFD